MQAAGWVHMPGGGEGPRGAQCDYTLYWGGNAGRRCPRNGFHRRGDKLYCLNHHRLVTKREENPGRVGRRKKAREPLPAPAEPCCDGCEEGGACEGTAPEASPAPAAPSRKAEPERTPEPVQELEIPQRDDEPDRSARELDAAELALWKDRVRHKMKRKMKERYRPRQQTADRVFERYRYKNPRKMLKGAMRQATLMSSMGSNDRAAPWLLNTD